MSYTPPEYPSTIPGTDDLPDRVDDIDWWYAARYNELKKELRAIMIELGVLPKGSQATVKDRLDTLKIPEVNRGDPADRDFDAGDFITDYTWRDLDLSAIVPAGAKAVSITGYVLDDVAYSTLEFREKGNTNIFNRIVGSTPAANVADYFNGRVWCDTNRVIQYRGKNVTFTGIGLTITGWFF